MLCDCLFVRSYRTFTGRIHDVVCLGRSQKGAQKRRRANFIILANISFGLESVAVVVVVVVQHHEAPGQFDATNVGVARSHLQHQKDNDDIPK